tara:strand:- start:6 stop:890 length:885 start_codon:yes stop_codon:yes gene_type:complete
MFWRLKIILIGKEGLVVIEKNSLLIRTLSSFVMLTIFIFVVHSNNLIFLIFSQLLLFLASWETLRMLEFRSFEKNKEGKSNFLLSRYQIRKQDLILIILINFFVILLNFPFFIIKILCLILITVYLIKLNDISIVKIIYLLYVTISFIFLNKMSQSSEFISFIFFIVFFTMLVDVSAYFIGSIIGGPKIMPNVSPNKTVAGCIGGLVVPIFVCTIIFFNNSSISNIIFFSFLFSVVSQVGDLIESGFKRYCCVKDSSNIIPGHGGLLDRFDSIFALIVFISIIKLLDYNFFFMI